MSIKINKDGSITKDGKTYKNKSEYAKAQKKSRRNKSDSGAKWWEGWRAKRDRAATKKGMAESKMKSTVAKAEKKYAKESMFPKARDEQRTKTAKARPFKTAFDDATSKGKSQFLWKGKKYLTTKGKREDRFGSSKDIKKVPNLEERRMKKRVEWMKKRKEAGKSYSAKNLAELTAKLEKVNVI